MDLLWIQKRVWMLSSYELLHRIARLRKQMPPRFRKRLFQPSTVIPQSQNSVFLFLKVVQ